MLSIDKDIPIPDETRGRKMIYPLRNMAVGESFLVTDATRGQRSSVYVCAARVGVRVTSRAVDGGIRFWRIE